MTQVLGGICSFAETAPEVRSDQISGVRARFNPGKEFKRTLDAIEFNKTA
jgi:hypothetical protein